MSMCKNFNDVFYLPGDYLTAPDLATHEIDTTSKAPIFVKPYRIPESQQIEIAKQVKEIEADGIIKASNSSWNALLLAVPKKAGSDGKPRLRVVVDFRRLNNVTIGDAYPLPNITDILDKLVFFQQSIFPR